jgi:hypothetical protein
MELGDTARYGPTSVVARGQITENRERDGFACIERHQAFAITENIAHSYSVIRAAKHHQTLLVARGNITKHHTQAFGQTH